MSLLKKISTSNLAVSVNIKKYKSLSVLIFYILINRNVRKKMILLQYKTFRLQTIWSVVVYIPSLIIMIYVINEKPGWAYDSNVIMSNLTFNVASSVIIIMGLVSLVLSFEPNWVTMLSKFSHYLTTYKVSETDDTE